jgi:hypothetical protein
LLSVWSVKGEQGWSGSFKSRRGAGERLSAFKARRDGSHCGDDGMA